MFKYFKNLFYRYKLEFFIKNIYFFDYIDILDKYEEFEPTDLVGNSEIIVRPGKNGFWATRDENLENIDIYFNHIRIHLTNKEDNKMIQIFLKKRYDDWVVSKKDDTYDFSSPLNKNIEIYRWYDFVYMNDRNYSDEKFLEGTWNLTVLKDLKLLDRTIRMVTDEAQVSYSYSDENTKNKDNNVQFSEVPLSEKNDGEVDEYTL